ncbi:MAG: sarcosine oxidase subunit gamma family protein, partial [Sedimenticola sp.]
MSDAVRSESPFVQVDLDAFNRGLGVQAGVRIEEQPSLGHINLRGSPGDVFFLEKSERVLGVALPLTPNSTAAGTGAKVFWMGPDEWLLVTPVGDQEKLGDELREALTDEFVAVTDVSSGQTLLSISGENSRRLLSKGCPLDIHPRVFEVGDCAQTHLAKCGVLLHLVDQAPVFELVVRRSFSDYLGIWLLDA